MEPNFGFIMGIFFLLNKEFQKVCRDIWKIYGFTAHLAIIHIFQNKVILRSKLQYNNLGKVMQRLPIFLHSTILFCCFLSFQQRVIRPFFLLKTLAQKVPIYGHLRVDFQQCWKFQQRNCRISPPFQQAQTHYLRGFPVFSTTSGLFWRENNKRA